jgi:putative PIN family toxin of toxin-antitoxin system
MTLRSEVRAVFDTNVLISAFLFPTSTPRRAFDFAVEHGKLLISLPLLREVYGVLHYPKFDQYASTAQRTQFVDLLTTVGTLTTITVRLQVARDPKDNLVLELAVSGAASVIISGDSDLLTLGRYDSIPIRTPAQFLQDPSQL